MEIIGEMLRKEDHNVPPDQDFRLLADQLREALKYIAPTVEKGDYKGAAKDMVLLEPTLRSIGRLTETLGSGFGIGICALQNSATQVSQGELTRAMWDCWCTALLKILSEPTLSADCASDLAHELEDHGFNTEPPDWQVVSEMLSSLESSDLHDTRADELNQS